MTCGKSVSLERRFSDWKLPPGSDSVEISFLKASSERLWGRVSAALVRIEAAQSSDTSTAIDATDRIFRWRRLLVTYYTDFEIGYHQRLRLALLQWCAELQSHAGFA